MGESDCNTLAGGALVSDSDISYGSTCSGLVRSCASTGPALAHAATAIANRIRARVERGCSTQATRDSDVCLVVIGGAYPRACAPAIHTPVESTSEVNKDRQ